MDLIYLIYRYITHADFFNINKPPGTERMGGGQSYIDFRSSQISEAQWRTFLNDADGVKEQIREQGPSWTFPVFNLGVLEESPQEVTIYQRRPATFSIASQKLGTSKSNRLRAWHPSNGFPYPEDPLNREQAPDDLVIYLAKTKDNKIYAGWLINNGSHTNRFEVPGSAVIMDKVIPPEHQLGDCGFVDLTGRSLNLSIPKRSVLRRKGNPAPTLEDSDLIEHFFDQDEGPQGKSPAPIREKIARVRRRNHRAVRYLKALYRGQCQVSGRVYTFYKRDGRLYCEAHHLVPLSEDGADHPFNIVILSPLIHRMLHYGNVEGLDLGQIQKSEDGSAHLSFRINGEPFTLKWHPAHAQTIENISENMS